MSRVRKLIAVATLAVTALPPLEATAQTANGARILYEVESAQQVYNIAVDSCVPAHISNSTLLSQCRTLADDIHTVVLEWHASFDAGTLTVAYDAAAEQTLYDYETELKGDLAAAGYTYTRPNVAAGESGLEVAPDDLSPLVTDCQSCFVATAGVTALCAKFAPGPSKIACAVVAVGGIAVCSFGVCSRPPDPPKSCTKPA